MQQMMREHGAPLREATDVLITRLSEDGTKEVILLALEFCSALPAGNNAWQRNGRALACATVGIPYLYFADVGGVELNEKRSVKASRFPNPIVPFSYLTASRAYGVVCLPVCTPSPSSSGTIRTAFAPAFGLDIGRRLVRAVIEGESHVEVEAALSARALVAVEILAAQRKRPDTLRGVEWRQFLDKATAQEKSSWLESRAMPWGRKVAQKVAVSSTFPWLVNVVKEFCSLAVGAATIPMCLVPQHKSAALAGRIQELYRGALSNDFVHWLAMTDRPLAIVWITGFKPGGDDSRPDRGLVPLARMLLGNEARILATVYGPGKAEMWQSFRRDPAGLAIVNGLWEAVFNLSDAILADSVTLQGGPHAVLTHREPHERRGMAAFTSVAASSEFSEQDVDAALHLLFSRQAGGDIFEGLCNPPGGDWSGVTLRDFSSGIEYRWTSLRRVSGEGRKRPDHVIEILEHADRIVLVAIESKDTARKLENGVGQRMNKFTQDLLASPPTISKTNGGEWTLYSGAAIRLVADVISAGAFCWTTIEDLERALERGKLDAAFAFQFSSGEQPSLLRIRTRPHASFLGPILRKAAERFGGRLEVQID
ncbi:MAG: hypothetical protein ACREUU_19205 [Gammaproteobacteria bacterium]